MSAREAEPPTFTPRAYLRDHAGHLAIVAVCVAALAFMLTIFGLNASSVAVSCVVAALGPAAALIWDYLRKRSFYRNLQAVVSHLEHARHLSAFVSQPAFLEGRAAFEALTTLAQAAGDELGQATQDADDYRSYVQTWVHEVKTPLAAARLILARMRGPEATALRQELERMERHVEQVLFYARSMGIEGDYAIRQVRLAHIAREAAKRNQNLLISSNVSLEVAIDEGCAACADPSWLTFVVGQLLANAAKYGASRIVVSACEQGAGSAGSVRLEVADDGWGVPAADMPRIFEHGFAGANGRAQGSATGMGLFICARLCASMGIGIDAYSEEGRGTRMVLTLPLNRTHLELAEGVPATQHRENHDANLTPA